MDRRMRQVLRGGSSAPAALVLSKAGAIFRALGHMPTWQVTLHPTPYTLHPTPYTQHPTPYTLHPTPYTPHPAPYTFHPSS